MQSLNFLRSSSKVNLESYIKSLYNLGGILSYHDYIYNNFSLGDNYNYFYGIDFDLDLRKIYYSFDACCLCFVHRYYIIDYKEGKSFGFDLNFLGSECIKVKSHFLSVIERFENFSGYGSVDDLLRYYGSFVSGLLVDVYFDFSSSRLLSISYDKDGDSFCYPYSFLQSLSDRDYYLSKGFNYLGRCFSSFDSESIKCKLVDYL